MHNCAQPHFNDIACYINPSIDDIYILYYNCIYIRYNRSVSELY